MSDYSMQQDTVFGVFSTAQQAQQAIMQLLQTGFSGDEVTVFAQDETVAAQVASATGVRSGADNNEGGLLDRLGDLFTGGDDDSMSMINSLGLSAAQQQAYNAGGVLVVVRSGTARYAEATRIVSGDMGYSTSSTTTSSSTTSSGSAMTGQTIQTSDADVLRVPVVEEQLTATKQQRQAGEVEIRKEVIEEQVSIPVELRHEEVTVTRRDVNRPLQAGEQVLEDGDVIRVPLREETVQVQKQARVTGEVEINKQVVVEQQTVSDTVRREEVEVDTIGNVTNRVEETGQTDIRTRNQQ